MGPFLGTEEDTEKFLNIFVIVCCTNFWRCNILAVNFQGRLDRKSKTLNKKPGHWWGHTS